LLGNLKKEEKLGAIALVFLGFDLFAPL